jgi:hypothetical protein
MQRSVPGVINRLFAGRSILFSTKRRLANWLLIAALGSNSNRSKLSRKVQLFAEKLHSIGDTRKILERIVIHPTASARRTPHRSESIDHVLFCSRGSLRLLNERLNHLPVDVLHQIVPEGGN